MEHSGGLAMETDRLTLKIGHLPTLYHTSFTLMGTSILKDHGVDAKWTLFPSGPDVVNAMRYGHIDLGYVGLPPAIIGIDTGVQLICIAGAHVEGTVLIAREDVTPADRCADMAEFLQQFSGAAIGCPPRGSIHDVIVNELLKEHHIKDVCVNNYAWADFLPDALAEGDIAAAAGTPALAVVAQRYYKAQMVVPPARLWPCNPSCGIVVMRQDLTDRTDVLRKFLSAHEKACEMIRENPRKCARVVARTTGIVDESFMADLYQISPKYCAALSAEYVSSTMKLVNALNTLGYIARRVSETEIFDVSLIKEVHTAQPHYQCQRSAKLRKMSEQKRPGHSSAAKRDHQAASCAQ